MNQEAHTYRCFALMRPDGGWRRWTFAPDRQKTLDRMQALSRGDVLFSSVQAFPRPANMVGYLKWRDVCEQYRGEKPLPHIAPLYFDIDCAEGLGDALTLTHALHDFFTVELGVAPAHIRAWFSGSKGAHLLVHPDALGIQPSPTLTSDMKPIVVHLCQRLARENGIAQLSADERVYSLPRMLRMENELNPRSDLYKVRLTPKELATCDPEYIRSLSVAPRTPQPALPDTPPVSDTAKTWWRKALRDARAPQEFLKRTAALGGVRVRADGFAEDRLLAKDMPGCMKALLKASPPAGGRNRGELQIACWARSAGRSERDARSILARWILRNRQELPSHQAQARARGIVHAAWAGKYGFSCAGVRGALRHAGLSADCTSCNAVERKSLLLSSAFRVGASVIAPKPIISMEDAHGRICQLASLACA